MSGHFTRLAVVQNTTDTSKYFAEVQPQNFNRPGQYRLEVKVKDAWNPSQCQTREGLRSCVVESCVPSSWIVQTFNMTCGRGYKDGTNGCEADGNICRKASVKLDEKLLTSPQTDQNTTSGTIHDNSSLTVQLPSDSNERDYVVEKIPSKCIHSEPFVGKQASFEFNAVGSYTVQLAPRFSNLGLEPCELVHDLSVDCATGYERHGLGCRVKSEPCKSDRKVETKEGCASLFDIVLPNHQAHISASNH